MLLFAHLTPALDLSEVKRQCRSARAAAARPVYLDVGPVPVAALREPPELPQLTLGLFVSPPRLEAHWRGLAFAAWNLQVLASDLPATREYIGSVAGAIDAWCETADGVWLFQAKHSDAPVLRGFRRSEAIHQAAHGYFRRSVSYLDIVVRTQRRDRQVAESLRALLERCGCLAAVEEADQVRPRERAELRAALPDGPKLALPRESRAGPGRSTTAEAPSGDDDGAHPPTRARG